jgi:hypothetical protein
MKLLNLFLLIFLLLSCVDLQKGSQLHQLEVLNKSLDSVTTVLIENKIEQLEAISRHARTIEKRINENYESDTIEFSFGKKMDAFKQMLASIEILEAHYKELSSHTSHTKQALDQLKNDIEHGDGEREKYDEFVAHEQIKVALLRQSLAYYVTTKNRSTQVFNQLHQEINEFSLNLLRKKTKSKK